MTNSTNSKTELISRKGFSLTMYLDFIVKIFAFMLLSSVLNDNMVFLGIIPSRSNTFFLSGMILFAVFFEMCVIVENLILNLTLLDYKKNIVYLFIQIFISIFSSILICSYLIKCINTIPFFNVVLISVVFSMLKVTIKVFFIDFSEVMLFFLFSVYGNYTHYALTFNNSYNNMLIYSFSVVIALCLLSYFFQKYIIKKYFTKLMNPKNYIQTTFVLFSFFILSCPFYLFVTFIFEQIGILEITSYTQLIVLFFIRFLINGQTPLSFSHINTKTKSYSYI